MEITINRYRVEMYEDGSQTLRKSLSDIYASSEREAILSVTKDVWWYDEGSGYYHKKIKYPVKFKAVLTN